MCALLRAIAVTTEYQSDSSSKRPRSSVVFAARALTRASPLQCQKMREGFYAGKLTLAGESHISIAGWGLDKGSFHIS